MAFLPTLTWIRFGVWTVIGIAVYFGYSMRHSKLAEQPPVPVAVAADVREQKILTE
jgi:APA family basic amino acid/polyamine antiporter